VIGRYAIISYRNPRDSIVCNIVLLVLTHQAQVFYTIIYSQMRKNTPISLIDLKQKIESFKNDINNFSKENESQLEHQLKDIKDDVQFILLESTDRQNERIQRRTQRNEEIEKHNKQGPHNAKLQYIKDNTEEFLATMRKK